MLLKQWPYEAAAIAFEVIPRTLAQNCGVNVIRTMTTLQGKVSLRLPFFLRLYMFQIPNLSLMDSVFFVWYY